MLPVSWGVQEHRSKCARPLEMKQVRWHIHTSPEARLDGDAEALGSIRTPMKPMHSLGDCQRIHIPQLPWQQHKCDKAGQQRHLEYHAVKGPCVHVLLRRIN